MSRNLAYYYANRDTMLAQQRAYYHENRVRIIRRQLRSRKARLMLRTGPISARRTSYSAAKLIQPPRPLVRVVPAPAYDDDSLTEIVDVDDFWFVLFNGVE